MTGGQVALPITRPPSALSSRLGLAVAALLAVASTAAAQAVTHRGFAEVRGTFFPQAAVNDPRRGIADVVAREEVFVRAADWLRFAAGGEVRGNSYDQVEASWRVRFADRTRQRPALTVRRLSATLSRGGWTLDLGKQFIRWGKADIVTPTDRFAPRDYLSVIDSDFLPVRGARAVYSTEHDTFEAVVVPWFTPSRIPLLTQRWTVVPANVAVVDVTEPESLPGAVQTGGRWAHVGAGYEYSLSFFDGFNHLPNVQALGLPGVATLDTMRVVSGAPAAAAAAPDGAFALQRTYPRMRMYGGDAAVPTRWLTVKGEAAWFTTTTPLTDEFVLYVVQAERQTGEWLLIAGYAGSAITRPGGGATFAPDRGTTRAFLGRASYTIDSTRSAALEAAVRQDGDGVYVRGEFSRTSGAHWRTTVAGALIRGDSDDFIGQFRRNSHLSLAFRYSF